MKSRRTYWRAGAGLVAAALALPLVTLLCGCGGCGRDELPPSPEPAAAEEQTAPVPDVAAPERTALLKPGESPLALTNRVPAQTREERHQRAVEAHRAASAFAADRFGEIIQSKRLELAKKTADKYAAERDARQSDPAVSEAFSRMMEARKAYYEALRENDAYSSALDKEEEAFDELEHLRERKEQLEQER